MQLVEPNETDIFSFMYIESTITVPPRQIVEITLGIIVRFSHSVISDVLDGLKVVRFRHSAPKETTLYEKLFGCPVEFDAEFDEIVGTKRYLDYKTDGMFTMFRPLLDYYLRQRIRKMPVYDSSLSTTLGLAISCLLGTGKCTHEFVSNSLGLHPKKLQRLLAQEGKTFSGIQDFLWNLREYSRINRKTPSVRNKRSGWTYCWSPRLFLNGTIYSRGYPLDGYVTGRFSRLFKVTTNCQRSDAIEPYYHFRLRCSSNRGIISTKLQGL